MTQRDRDFPYKVALGDLDQRAAASPTWALVKSVRAAVTDRLGHDLRLRGYTVGRTDRPEPPYAARLAGSYSGRPGLIDLSRHIFLTGDQILSVRDQPWARDELVILARITHIVAHEHFHAGVPRGERWPSEEGFIDLLTTLSHAWILRQTGLADREPRILDPDFNFPIYAVETPAIASFICAAADLSGEAPDRTLDRILCEDNYYLGLSAVVRQVATRNGSPPQSHLGRKPGIQRHDRMISLVCKTLYQPNNFRHSFHPHRGYSSGLEFGREAALRMCDELGIDAAGRLVSGDPLARLAGGASVAQALTKANAGIEISPGPLGWYLVNSKAPAWGLTLFPEHPQDQLLERLASLKPRTLGQPEYLYPNWLWHMTDELRSRNWLQRALDRTLVD